MLITSSVDIPEARIELRKDGLVHVDLKPEYTLTLDQMKKVIAAREKLVNGKKYPMLITSPKFLVPTEEATNHFTTEAARETALADAFIIQSEPQTIAAKHFLFSGKAVRPTQVFDNQEDAIQWLLKFSN